VVDDAVLDELNVVVANVVVAVKDTVIGPSLLKYPQSYPDAGTSGHVYVQQYGFADELFPPSASPGV
jgi:hypothetical protein